MKKIIFSLLALIITFSFALPNLIIKNQSVKAEEIEIINLNENEKTALNLLNQIKETYKFQSATKEFLLESSLEVAYGKVFRLVQIKDGVKVYGRGINITADKKGNLLSVNSSYLRIDRLRPEKVSESEAKIKAEELIGSEAKSIEKIIYSLEGLEKYPTYAYYITFIGANVIISANDGNILLNENNASNIEASATQLNTYNESITFTVDKDDEDILTLCDKKRNIYAFDLHNYDYQYIDYATPITTTKNNKNIFIDKAAVSAYYNIIKSYDFYADAKNIGVSLQGMNNKNDQTWGNDSEIGSEEVQLYVYMHYGTGYYTDNASYAYVDPTLSYFYIGDGYSVVDKPGSALDVIAHEYQHGITRNIVDLGNSGESGAINESISDIFGMLIEGNDIFSEEFWLIGERCAKNGKWVRNVIHPEDSGTINKTTGKFIDSGNKINLQDGHKCPSDNHEHDANCDYGGVHFNSTILTHMQYRMWKEMPEAFTKEAIGKLWYTTLTKLSNVTVTFKEFGQQMIVAASELDFSEQAQKCIKDNLYKSGILTDDETTHIVKFVNSLDGSIIEEYSVKDGEDVTPPSAPYDIPNGYSFTGWNGDLSNVKENRTISAEFSIIQYTVTFKDEDGTIYKTEKVQGGKDATPPKNVSKKSQGMIDFVFDYWIGDYTDINADTEIIAKFKTIQCYNVTFKDGEDIVTTLRVQTGNSAILPDSPIKQGYIFDGWYTDSDLSEAFDASQKITKDITVFAKWTEDTNSKPQDENNGDDKDGCAACGTFTFGSGMLPPTMLLLIISAMALTILLPKRKSDKTK